jgi:hypothetical protein
LVIKRAEAAGNQLPRAGVEEIIVGLKGMKLTAIYELVQRCYLAQTAEAKVPDSPAISHFLKAGNDTLWTEHFLGS